MVSLPQCQDVRKTWTRKNNTIPVSSGPFYISFLSSTSWTVLRFKYFLSFEDKAILPNLFLSVRNASKSLVGVERSVQGADELKNITANLQAQLRQNMSALEEKLTRAREYVAKVENLTNYECLGHFKCMTT